MPYTVTVAGVADTTVLAYRWEEDVLAPDDGASVGLARMIGAQVALNDGLFCREIAFRGAPSWPAAERTAC